MIGELSCLRDRDLVVLQGRLAEVHGRGVASDLLLAVRGQAVFDSDLLELALLPWHARNTKRSAQNIVRGVALLHTVAPSHTIRVSSGPVPHILVDN